MKKFFLRCRLYTRWVFSDGCGRAVSILGHKFSPPKLYPVHRKQQIYPKRRTVRLWRRRMLSCGKLHKHVLCDSGTGGQAATSLVHNLLRVMMHDITARPVPYASRVLADVVCNAAGVPKLQSCRQTSLGCKSC